MQQCIDQFIQPACTMRANLNLDRWSLLLSAFFDRISKHARYPKKRVTVKTSYIRLPSYLSHLPLLECRGILSLSLSPPMVVSFVFAQGSSGAPIESTPVTRSNGGCRNNSSMSIYVEGRMVGNNESGTNYQNNEGKKRRKVSRTD